MCQHRSSTADKLPNLGDAAPCRKMKNLSHRGYTLVEVMIVLGLLTALIASASAVLYTANFIARRLSNYTAAFAVVEAKLEDIRAGTYNPPNSPFTASVVTLTSNTTIALNQAGVSFVVPGSLTSRIEPVASGHLVTVTGTFQTRRRPITVVLQTVVNRYSAGQQK
jgi:prepilin-type N-terminal cleavage/methylation domain-containing protein